MDAVVRPEHDHDRLYGTYVQSCSGVGVLLPNNACSHLRRFDVVLGDLSFEIGFENNFTGKRYASPHARQAEV